MFQNYDLSNVNWPKVEEFDLTMIILPTNQVCAIGFVGEFLPHCWLSEEFVDLTYWFWPSARAFWPSLHRPAGLQTRRTFLGLFQLFYVKRSGLGFRAQANRRACMQACIHIGRAVMHASCLYAACMLGQHACWMYFVVSKLGEDPKGPPPNPHQVKSFAFYCLYSFYSK